MNTAITDFQDDQAVILSEQILRKTGESVQPVRIVSILVKHGVVGEFTAWKKLPDVLNDLGFDYDEIVEVAP